MADQLLGGAAIGTGFSEGVKLITRLGHKALKFKTTRENLASAVERVAPVVEEMRRCDEELGRPADETEPLIEDLKAAQERVRRYSGKRSWNICCWPCYQDQLQALEEVLNRPLDWMIARDTKQTLLTVKNSSIGKHFNGLCMAPEGPELIVGLEEPFHKLRAELLKEGSGVSVHVVTGWPGSGKTTLAKKLCLDQQIRDKFGKQILYVTLSRSPNLKAIVQSIFHHCEHTVPAFQSDEDAINRLKNLLKEIGKNPLLLVLDDAWHGSECFIEAVRLRLPCYKILVTSRASFPAFRTACCLKPLCHDNAIRLFRHFALPEDSSSSSSSYIPDEDFVEKVAIGCRGLPLALEVIGSSLRGQPIEVWQKMEKDLSRGCNADWLSCIQKCLDVLEDKPIIRECFMDLGLFPEDQRIPVAALNYMWQKLYKLDDEEGIDAMNKVYELINRHLAKLVVTRETSDVDNYYNHHFLMQHDLLRELAIRQGHQEPLEQWKRLQIFDTNENDRPEQYWQEQMQQNFAACTLSISTDKKFTSENWCGNIFPSEVEVLVLNLRTNEYTLPEFLKKMSKLEVLIVTSFYGFQLSKLHNFELLGFLSSLKRIRLEQVSVPSLGKLNNLQNLSLYMCNTSKAFGSGTNSISNAFPNLVELNIDYSKDLVELPDGLCDIATLKKLSFTKCHRLSALPREIEKLEKLETLRLNSCSKLREIPISIGKLHKLSCLDISYCTSLSKLPEEIGDLCNLRRLYMPGCSTCELPSSVSKLKNLRTVICDEERTTFWELWKPSPSLKIGLPTVDANLHWLPSRDLIL